MAGSIFLSGSRGGMLAFCAQMIVSGRASVALATGQLEKTAHAGRFPDCSSSASWSGWAATNSRAAWPAFTRRLERKSTEAFALPLIATACVCFSRGPSSAGDSAPSRSSTRNSAASTPLFFVNQAHNDYLQLLVETGLAGFAIADLVSRAGLPPGRCQAEGLERDQHRRADGGRFARLCRHPGT